MRVELIQTGLLGLILAIVLYQLLKNQTPRLKGKLARAILLDSSALIDGRVVEVARNGFLGGTLVVPSSVLREMQYLADNSDSDKRARARHGLDVVKELQNLDGIEVQILDDGLPGDGGVDERLVLLGKRHNADLLTLDFNLNKVAQAENLRVLNINQLAQNLRMSYLPGEKRSLTLVQKGQDSHQAVGYLEDGTMVVVEQAGNQVGQSVEVEFTRALQTQAGKMLFAKKTNTSAPRSQPARTPKPARSRQPAPRQRSTSSRRRSPEDSLVELANK